MVKKFYLSLDYASPTQAIHADAAARRELRQAFAIRKLDVDQDVGVKINIDQFTGHVHHDLAALPGVFADAKIAHGSDTAVRVLDRLEGLFADLEMVTFDAKMGPKILRETTDAAHARGLEAVAFTIHTKTSPEDVERMYGTRDLDKVMLMLGKIAVDAGCDTMVLEAERLKNPEIVKLPIKKLVTGIRIDRADAGTQSRVTTLDQLRAVLPAVDYVVVSSRYLEDTAALTHYFSEILRR